MVTELAHRSGVFAPYVALQDFFVYSHVCVACDAHESVKRPRCTANALWRASIEVWGRYHGGRRLSSDDSFHSQTVILLSALDKPSIMKRYHRRRTCSHTSPGRWPKMVTLHDTRVVECRWWNDGWTVKTVVT